MSVLNAATTLSAFLITYALHSTFMIGGAWLILCIRRTVFSPGLRLQLWKLAIVAPVITASLATGFNLPHVGFKFSLADEGAASSRITNDPSGSGVPSELPSDSTFASGSGESTVQVGRDFKTRTASPLIPENAPADSSNASSGPASSLRGRFVILVSAGWLFFASLGVIRLMQEYQRLQTLRRNSSVLNHADLLNSFRRVRCSLGLSRKVVLLSSPQVDGPFAGGIREPYIMFPATYFAQPGQFSPPELDAVLAHELAHVVHRDSGWNLFFQIVCRVLFFQPLNCFAVRESRQEMDFVADSTAGFLLGERVALANCLVRVVEARMSHSHLARIPTLTSGMAIFESTLGRRIEMLLDDRRCLAPPARSMRICMTVSAIAVAAFLAITSPRAVSQASLSQDLPSPSLTTEKVGTMKTPLAALIMATGLAAPATADEGPDAAKSPAAAAVVPLKTTVDELPQGIHGFNGMLVGRIAAKDPETGTFTVLVDAVSRVWENSRAESPRSIVGKTVSIEGVFGRFLDVLVVTRVGETVEFECKFEDGRLLFPGELLRKVAPYSAEEYPILPDAFRGFRGQVAAEVIKKDAETFEMILRVDQVRNTWDGNQAKEPKSIEGMSVSLIGFWNRREVFNEMKVGSKIEVGMHHKTPTSDHLTVIEDVRILEGQASKRSSEKPRMERERMEKERMQKGPERGFRGMLVGRLVEKDVEQGTFTVTVDAVPRVWENNEFDNPKSLIGRNVAIEGVGGRLLDALVVARQGETLEFGALSEGGERLHVGEVLHKVSPVKPGDYPVLPDEFRGFRGVATARIVRKSDELHEFVVEVETIEELFDGNQAEQPRSIVGKRLLLGGFWNRKDAFHELKVGDRIRCGMIHRQVLSDLVEAAEVLQKLDEQ